MWRFEDTNSLDIAPTRVATSILPVVVVVVVSRVAAIVLNRAHSRVVFFPPFLAGVAKCALPVE